MYGGGPALRRGGKTGGCAEADAESSPANPGTTAHATTAVSVCTGSIRAVVRAVRGREASVAQQSAALPCEAHFNSPSLQHAICMLDVDAAASAHSAHSDQLNAVASASARTRMDRRRLILL